MILFPRYHMHRTDWSVQVLVRAKALSYRVTDYIGGGAITAVIVLDVSIGFDQNFQAEEKIVSIPNTLHWKNRLSVANLGFVTSPSGSCRS